jgi:hypothetical protein
MTKLCSSCKQRKGPTAFHRDNSRGDGLYYRCRACVSAEKAARRQGRPPPSTLERALPDCERCRDHQHGPLCLGPSADCGCRCRAMLGLEGPFEFGDPTAPTIGEGWAS